MASRKGQFKKGGGRVGGGSTTKRGRKAGGNDSATAIVVMPSRAVRSQRKSRGHTHASHHPAKKSKHRKSGASGITPMKIVASALVLSSAAGTNNGPLGGHVYDLVQKIPGAKTLGGAATAGLVLGAMGKYTGIGGAKIKPWLKTAGIIGLVLAAAKIGEAGTAFKWVGDPYRNGDDSVMDVET